MKKINRLMAACDLSDYSISALKYAVELAEILEAEVIIVNVINQRDVDAVRQFEVYTDRMPLNNYIKDMKEYRTHEINAVMKKMSHIKVSWKLMIVIGVPFQEIIEAAKLEKADILVMGPKGRTDFEHVVFGSTAEKVSRQCPIPLLTVRNNN